MISIISASKRRGDGGKKIGLALILWPVLQLEDYMKAENASVKRMEYY
jgi:hypothetical protein